MRQESALHEENRSGDLANGLHGFSALQRPGSRIHSGAMPEKLVINEIYLSIQGESTFAGLPCVFIRLTACNLRCSYCDTAYAFKEGTERTLDEIVVKVKRLAEPYHSLDQSLLASAATNTDCGRLPLVELTGGEPLLQANAIPFMRRLCDEGFTVLLETTGASDIEPVDARVHRIMDLKCPSSGEVERNRWQNLKHLRATDEIKCVIGTAEDYEWSKQQVTENHLNEICPVLFSWVSPLEPHQRDHSLKPIPAGQTAMSRNALVERIIGDALPVRFQLQMHTFILPPDAKGG